MTEMITTVVFDLDDTLYDEIEYCRSGFRAVAEFVAAEHDRLSAESIFEALWGQFSSGNRGQTFNGALDELPIEYNSAFIRRLVEVYRTHKPQIELAESARAVLDELGKEYTLALLTDGFLPAQQLKVQSLGIEKYFKAIVYTEQLGREFWKPSPVGFEKLMKTFNTQGENMAYVADNVKKDFIAPNKLGFLTIQLRRPAGIHNESADGPAAAAKQIICDISQLPAVLRESF
jgi:putative hydrolase of the HAD superfamily